MVDDRIQTDPNLRRQPSLSQASLLTVVRSFGKPAHYMGVILVPMLMSLLTLFLCLYVQHHPETQIHALGVWLVGTLIGCPILVMIIRKLVTSEQITITSETVHVKVWSFGTLTNWSEPLKHYTGILKTQHLGGWSPAASREKPTVLCLYLVHPDRAKTVLLWKEQSGQRAEEIKARKLWLQYGRLLDVVSLEETPYGMKEYHPEDLQDQIAGRKATQTNPDRNSTRVRPDHIPITSFLEQFASERAGLQTTSEPPESAGIQVQVEDHFLKITYPGSASRTIQWSHRGDIVMSVLLFGLGIAGISTGAASVGCFASILLLAGVLFGFVAWMRWNIKYEVLVTPETISYCWMGPTQRVEVAILRVRELEEMEVKQHYCSIGDELSQPGVDWAVVFITSDQIQPVGRGLPKETLRWLKTVIIDWLCEWYSRGSEKKRDDGNTWSE
ncbi:MAG: hypothetical protein ACFCD0_06155 [Gemmataceae bacterium]